jgi:hypothetical protein
VNAQPIVLGEFKSPGFCIKPVLGILYQELNKNDGIPAIQTFYNAVQIFIAAASADYIIQIS